jgi:lipid-binding SYLF domain-containing protein
MKKFVLIACGCAITLTGLRSFAAHSNADLVKRCDAAARVIQEIQSVPAKAIPNWLVSKATCVAVVPSFKKAAFVVGGSYGQGVVTCRTNGDHWSSPAFIQLEGGSWGLQIGGQATDLVLVATNQDGMQSLLKSKFKIGADAAAAAGPVGRNAAADTNLYLKSELLTYSRSKGLFAGIDLTGTVVHQNTDATREFYGRNVSFEDVLQGHLTIPSAAHNFVKTVARYFNRATH